MLDKNELNINIIIEKHRKKIEKVREECNHKGFWMAGGQSVLGPPVISNLITVLTVVYCTNCSWAEYHRYNIELIQSPVSKPNVTIPGKIES